MQIDLVDVGLILGLISTGAGLVFGYYKWIEDQGDRGETAARKVSQNWEEAHKQLEGRVVSMESRLARLPTKEEMQGAQKDIAGLESDISALSEKVDGLKRELSARDDVTLARLDAMGKQMDGIDQRVQTIVDHLIAKENTK